MGGGTKERRDGKEEGQEVGGRGGRKERTRGKGQEK